MSISTTNPQVATLTRYRFVAAGAETSVSGIDANGAVLAYVVGKEQVYLNGVLLVRGQDYTASNGTSITGLSPALVAGDVTEVLTFSEFVIANAVDQNLVSAKGDLIAATADNTVTNLAVGNNGETLVADSSTSTGLRYQGSTAAGKNGFINGGFDVWQRGTSSTGTAYNYTADRWLNFRGAFASGATFSRIASTQTGFQYALRLQRDSGNTGTDVIHLRQALETTDSLRFANQTVTVSFYARAGANFSAASSILVSQIYQGEGTDQPANNMTGWTSVTAINQNNTLTTSWQRFTQTTTISSAKTQFGIAFTYTPVGTAGAADNYDITGVQVEIGSVATPFSRAGGTIQGELAACQRYYYQWTAANNFSPFATGFTSATTTANLFKPMPVTMRITPTITTTGTAANYAIQNGTNGRVACSAVPAINQGNPDGLNVDFTTAAVLTAGGAITGNANNTTAAYLGFSAEL
jgi:hypothetical protein